MDLYSYDKRIFLSVIAGIDISLAINIHCPLAINSYRGSFMFQCEFSWVHLDRSHCIVRTWLRV